MQKNLLIKIAMLSILAILFGSSIFGQIGSEIPSDHRVDWTKAGYEGSIPTSYDHTIWVDQMAGNDKQKIQAAIDATEAYHNIAGNENKLVAIRFSSRVYNIDNDTIQNSNFYITESNIVFLGNGPENTELRLNISPTDSSKSTLFRILGSQPTTLADVASYNVTNNTITLSSGVSNLSAGDYIVIQATNDPLWYCCWEESEPEWAEDFMGQITKIKSKVSSTVYELEEHDFQITWGIISNRIDPGTTFATKMIPIQNVGFENLRITKPTDNEYPGNFFEFTWTANCWIKNVESETPSRIHCQMDYSIFNEVRDSYFSSASYIGGNASHAGGGPGGYGVFIGTLSTYCLVENNIFRDLRHSTMLTIGANRNVIGYNYSREKAMYLGDINIHGLYPYANLIEGNFADFFTADNYHSPNGPYNTFFRNRSYYHAPTQWKSIEIQGSSDFNVLGNETNINLIEGAQVYTDLYGYDRYDPIIYTGHTGWSSNKNETYFLTDISYYKLEEPSFFNSHHSWPPIGPRISRSGGLLSQSIPARERWCNDNPGTCDSSPLPKAASDDEDFITTQIPTEYNLSQNFPNPFNPSTTISYALPQEGQVTLKVYDSLGKLVTTLVNDYKQAGYYNVTLDGSSLASGVYLYRITSGSFTQSKKLILLK